MPAHVKIRRALVRDTGDVFAPVRETADRQRQAALKSGAHSFVGRIFVIQRKERHLVRSDKAGMCEYTGIILTISSPEKIVYGIREKHGILVMLALRFEFVLISDAVLFGLRSECGRSDRRVRAVIQTECIDTHFDKIGDEFLIPCTRDEVRKVNKPCTRGVGITLENVAVSVIEIVVSVIPFLEKR